MATDPAELERARLWRAQALRRRAALLARAAVLRGDADRARALRANWAAVLERDDGDAAGGAVTNPSGLGPRS